jgi:hypothetical protein
MSNGNTTPIPLPTMEAILARTPEKYTPFVRSLAPSVLALAALGLLDAWTWLERVIAGDQVGAFGQLLEVLEEAAFRAQWDASDDKLDAANAANNARIQAYRQAGIQTLRALAVAASIMVAL